jgi:hypothetical protein
VALFLERGFDATVDSTLLLLKILFLLQHVVFFSNTGTPIVTLEGILVSSHRSGLQLRPRSNLLSVHSELEANLATTAQIAQNSRKTMELLDPTRRGVSCYLRELIRRCANVCDWKGADMGSAR